MVPSRTAPVVLVALTNPEPAWTLPEVLLTGLQREFPAVDWRIARRWWEGYGPDLDEAEVAFVWHIPRREAARAARLRWVQSGATGVRRLLHPVWRERGVIVTSARGVQAPVVAEHVMALILSAARGIPAAARAQAGRRWDEAGVLAGGPWSLAGKRMLIVGFGEVGRQLARRAAPFGVAVTGVRLRPERGDEGAARVLGPESVDAELARADIVVDALPNTDETRGFFDRRRIGLMPRGAFFVNVGRGSTVDEAALVEALRSGRLRGAALDVCAEEPLPATSPLWDAPGILLTPHVAGAADVVWPALVARFVGNLNCYLAGRPLLGTVDWESGY